MVAAAGAGALALACDLGTPAAWTAGITALCAVWWVMEPMSTAATALIPFALFPLTGVLDHERVAAAYGHTLILLLMGGFILSVAIEKSGVHRRLALGMVRVAGGGGRRLVLGFMLASAMISMWISNTATVLMLLPVAMAVLEAEDQKRLATPLLLGIAYAASIGGMGTPVGTPPNIVFMGIYQQQTGSEVSFLEWMYFGVPAVIVLLPLSWLLLTRGMPAQEPPAIQVVGRWRPAEVRVLVVFALTAAAWIFRIEPHGGWSGLLGTRGASDSTVALAAVVAMFLIPDGEGGTLLDWNTAKNIPWGLLLLFGGGIAIAAGFDASGLSRALGSAIGEVAGSNIIVVTALVCVSVTFLSEIMSNTALTTLLMPILAVAAKGAGMDPRLLMIPAALAGSCGFMLPVATAPNAIVAGTSHITTRAMAREGFFLDLIGAVALTILCLLLL